MQQEFGLQLGRKAAEAGMDKANDAARVFDWQCDAGRWFMALPSGALISSDDLTRAVGVPDEGQNKNNAVGAFFNGLARARMIFWTGRTIKSERVTRHTGMIRVWQKA